MPTTFNAILSHVSHFLTVAIHVIVFERHVYPPESFITARAYNLPVKQNRHPGVCAWIQAAVGAVREQLAKGAVARVALAIAHPDSCDVLERFVFDFTRLPVVSKEDWDTPIERSEDTSFDAAVSRDPDAQGSSELEDHEFADLSEQFRATLSALSTCERRLGPLPKGCTFTVAIELKDDVDPPVGHPQPWIPTQPQPSKRLSRNEGDASTDGQGLYDVSSGDSTSQATGLGPSRVVALRRVDASEVLMEVWAEEGTAKATLGDADFAESANSSAGAQAVV